MKLADIRKYKKVSQRELAKKLNISQGAVSKIENSQNPKLSTLKNYIQALGGSLDIRIV